MTIEAIVKEIEKRLAQLDKKYEELYTNMIACKVRGDNNGEDKAIQKRREISSEKDKLQAMIHVYKRNW